MKSLTALLLVVIVVIALWFLKNTKSTDKSTTVIRPLLAIELDGRSHETVAGRERDENVERIFVGADLKLLRCANHGSPDRDEVKRRITEA